MTLMMTMLMMTLLMMKMMLLMAMMMMMMMMMMMVILVMMMMMMMLRTCIETLLQLPSLAKMSVLMRSFVPAPIRSLLCATNGAKGSTFPAFPPLWSGPEAMPSLC
ncbi:hypothetical protein CRM22_010796 [Opisthorchis felineus]|uniref:Uncharacterized protein n=1 Tax=Opisthorchis felineus TaxID=147828 RepID=A0A4S2KQP9_OPIFE|nr:hypothetical protein CRM22_010796 [Opisthorchis felineus]